ncbi:BatD family protein [Denitratisoma sp. DHT3]|uniref:BatD family protein n=1 Tax=Denitratisoma sp. DHT3 TaxID=1981880 RepID=UPI001647F37D|nr:BatD family protein [Denitratisoma sp. DHT3]
MNAVRICVGAVLLLALGLPAWAAAPFVRLSLEPAGPVELGTDLILRVEVLVPTWFLDAPRFPETIELPGATVELQKGSAENLSESIAGSTWAGLRRRYRIQPLNPGEFRLPELAVPLTYAREGGKGSLTVTARGRLVAPFGVRIPEAAARLDPFIAARRLHLAQRIERPEGAMSTLGVGDAVRRTIVLDTDAEAVELSADAWPQGAGLRLYVDPPRSRETRTNAAARPLLSREQSATWVFERPGRYELPAITLDWWDLDGRQVRQARLPAVPLVVGPARAATVFALPEAVAQLAPAGRPVWESLRPIAYALAGGVLLWLGWRGRHLGQGAARWARGRAQDVLAAEGWLFRRLIRACRRHDGSAARAALQRWLDACAGPGAGLTSWLLAKSPSAELAAALAELDAALYGSRGSDAAAPWCGTALSRQLILARRHLLRRRKAKAATLPATLNP